MGRVNDDTDRRLLALLVSNARQSTVALAKKLGLARTTVHERIARLEKTGVIQGYTAVLGASETADNFARCLVLLAILQKRQRAIVERIMAFPEVKLCLTINGEFDLMLSIEAPLNEDLDAIIDEVVTIDGVERSKSLIVLSTKFDRRGWITRAA
jgi:DNA-binding Lrp family transcriptional regulator